MWSRSMSWRPALAFQAAGVPQPVNGAHAGAPSLVPAAVRATRAPPRRASADRTIDDRPLLEGGAAHVRTDVAW
jgi:hypothetical protein